MTVERLPHPPAPTLQSETAALIRHMARIRAQTYVARIPAAISGQAGHNQTFAVARVLIHGFALTESDAWPILQAYNARCKPPWSAAELGHKLRDAATHASAHKHPRGHLLTKPRAGERIVRPRKPATPFPADRQLASTDATPSTFPDREAHNRAGLANLDSQARLGQVRLRHLPELSSPPSANDAADQYDRALSEKDEKAPISHLPVAPTGATRNSRPSLECASARVFLSPNSAAPDASPAIFDPPSSIPSSPTSTPETGLFARLRRGPTIQLPRGPLLTDPRTDPMTEWLHIQGYSSIPPRNCVVCWFERSRSLWIGVCLCEGGMTLLLRYQ